MFNLVALLPARSGHDAEMMTPDVRASFRPWPLLFPGHGFQPRRLSHNSAWKKRRFSPALFCCVDRQNKISDGWRRDDRRRIRSRGG
jgi:hypothetical protein